MKYEICVMVWILDIGNGIGYLILDIEYWILVFILLYYDIYGIYLFIDWIYWKLV